jgi:predicted kinase
MNGNPPRLTACLVVLVGAPASGKSTWARRNARGAVVIGQDELIDAITPTGFDHAYRPVYAAAEDAIARSALREGHTVIVDRTNRTRAHRKRWLGIARETACPAVAVQMDATAEECRERNASRTGHRRLSDERMRRMLAAFEPVAEGEGFAGVYSGSTTTVAEILGANRAAGRLRQEAACH